jgi:hypothetical protein
MIKFLVLFLLIPTTSYAYIDPGSGSSILMILLALLTSGLVFIKNFINRIKNFFKIFFFKIKNVTKTKKDEDK